MSKIEQLIQQLCPDGVEWKTLNNVCLKISAGGDLPDKYKKDQLQPSAEYPYPIYSNGTNKNSLYGFTDNYKITERSVTISARGTIGYHSVINGKFTPIIRLIVLIPETNIISADYLNYALTINEINHSGGSIPQLTVPNVKKIQIPIPPLPFKKKSSRFWISALLWNQH